MENYWLVCSTIVLVDCYFNVTQAETINIQWENNTTPNVVFDAVVPTHSGVLYTDAFNSDEEFRLINTDSNPQPGGGGEKSIIDGRQSWQFDSSTGILIGVKGTQITPGTNQNGSAAPQGDTGLFLTTAFLLPSPLGDIGLLASTQNSNAGQKYGAGRLDFQSMVDTFTIYFPVLEAQWGPLYFPLGAHNNRGVTFRCSGATTGDINCAGDHKIHRNEDIIDSGLANWTVQMELHGSSVAFALPIPAAYWLLGSGLVSLFTIKKRRALIVMATNKCVNGDAVQLVR